MTTFPPPNASPMSSLTPPPATPVNIPTAATTFDVKAVAIEIARLLSDDKCSDITLLDVRGISSVQDFVILASGTSDRQMRSAATDVKNMLPKLGSSVYRTSIDDQSTWIVVDCVDTVIHIFEPNTRSYYDLESMWGDAPKVEWLRPGQKPYTPDDQTNQLSESEDTAARDYRESRDEADADLELTTGTAETFAENVRTSVKKKPAASAKVKPVAKAKPATKAKAKPVKAAKKPAAPVKVKLAPVKKAAAKKAPAKPAKKTPTKKAAARPLKKAAKPVKKAATAKVVKKAAKKKGR